MIISWDSNFVKTGAEQKKHYHRFIDMYLTRFLNKAQRELIRSRFNMNIIKTSTTSHGIVGKNNVTIYLHDLDMNGIGLSTNTMIISHELIHMIIEFLFGEGGAELHRKLHRYHVNNAGEVSPNTPEIITWVDMKVSPKFGIIPHKQRVATLDYKKLVEITE